jgi:hypothetical protein
MFHSGTKRSQTFAFELNDYLSRNVLDGDNFVCRHARACKASSRADHFYEGQLHHIGRHYDLNKGRRPWRIVVCGQEYGSSHEHWSMEARYEQVTVGSGRASRFTATPGFRTRNSHMRGTTSLLRLWFGLGLGKDRQDEFIRVNEENTHIFDAFALVNFLMCTATDGGKKGKSTNVMQSYCAGHFRQIINIVKPTVLVCQGDRVSRWVREVFDVIPVGPQEGRIRTSILDTRVLEFSHPTAWGSKNWGWNERTPYLLETVEPTVRRVRDDMLRKT